MNYLCSCYLIPLYTRCDRYWWDLKSTNSSNSSIDSPSILLVWFISLLLFAINCYFYLSGTLSLS